MTDPHEGGGGASEGMERRDGDAGTPHATAAPPDVAGQGPRPMGGGLSRRAKTVLAVVAVLVLLLAGAAAYLLTPPGVKPYEDPISVEERSQNTALVAALQGAAVEATMVAVSLEHVIVAYELPDAAAANGTNVNETLALDYQRFVTGAAANAEPRTGRLEILQLLAGEPRLLWTVAMTDFRAFMLGQITVEELESRIDVQTFPPPTG